MNDTLVVGLGNTLLGDDGVGVRVVDALRADPAASGMELVDGGTLGFRLAARIAEHRACVLVDAARLQRAPGSVAVFEDKALLAWAADGQRAGVHEAGLVDLISVLTLEGRLPERLALVAVQPASVDWGEVLTPAVAAALPVACERVLTLRDDWSRASRRTG